MLIFVGSFEVRLVPPRPSTSHLPHSLFDVCYLSQPPSSDRSSSDKRSKMASLLTVPAEIQVRIICLLDDRYDRINLASCCSRLLAIVHFATYNPQLKVPTPCSWKLEGLLHFLLHYPQLARGVRRLELGQPSCGSHNHPAQPPESLDETVYSIVKKFSLDDQEETCWIDDLQRRRYPDAWMALILFLLPNLASLEWFWGRGTKYTERLLNRVSLHEPPFNKNQTLRSLAEVFFKVTERTAAGDPKTSDPGFQITKMAPFYRLSSMRKLTGQMVCGRVSEVVSPNSSSITHLELRQSSTSSGFAELIAPCTNLKSFRYFHMNCFENLHSAYNQRFSYHIPSEFMAPLGEKEGGYTRDSMPG